MKCLGFKRATLLLVGDLSNENNDTFTYFENYTRQMVGTEARVSRVYVCVIIVRISFGVQCKA